MTILLVVIAIAAALVVLGIIYQAAGVAADRRQYSPLGRMVDIGGRKLHLIEQGEGLPVVFEAGIAATCLNWTEVRGRVGEFARACAYDRAGLGWSDPPSREQDAPRTMPAMLQDVRELLGAAVLAKPFILVGHSFGGMLVCAYAATYPEDVAGLVLVDPLSPGEWINASPAHLRMLRLGVRLSGRGAWLARIGIVRAALAMLAAGGRRVPKLVAQASSGRGESVISRIVGEVQKMPAETWPMVRAHWCQPKSFLAMAAYLEALPACSREAAALRVPENIPVTVLSASNTPPEQLDERERIARRSSRGRHIVAQKSGHWIQLDEPELVVEAVREMLGARVAKLS